MKISLLFVTLLICTTSMAQNTEAKKQQLLKEIADLDAEIERLKNLPTQEEEYNTVCYQKTLYTKLQPMNEDQFASFCVQELAKVNDIPINVDERIISSCRQEGGIVSASFCVLSNPNAKLMDDEEKQLSKEKQLAKIRNTKEMYRNLIEALNKEITANKIEIADHAGDLAIKHLNVKEVENLKPIIQKYKDNGIDILEDKSGLKGRTNIKNETAEALDKGISAVEEIASYIPEGDKLTCHYLWRIFKSVPDAGRMLGNAGAAITIMFQRNEYEKKLKELEQQEQELLKNG